MFNFGGFVSGDNINRIRRGIAPSRPEESGGNGSSTVFFRVNGTSSTPLQSSTPALDARDINITMRCEGYWFSCRGRCKQERELGITEERIQCFCDESCELFRDCCADFDQYCSSSGISAQQERDAYEEQWECIQSKALTEAFGVWMISSCPKNWTQTDVKELCGKSEVISYDNHKDHVPVIDQRGNTYKNLYCAQCQGVGLSELTFYNLQFGCDISVSKWYTRNEIWEFLFNFCGTPYWRPPRGATRRYCHNVGSNDYCYDNSLSAKVQKKCVNGSLRVVYRDGLQPENYFNPYCALCSNVKNVTCGPSPSRKRNSLSLAKPFSLVMDLDFSDDDAPAVKLKVKKLKISCLEDYVYDFHLQVCRPGITPFDSTSNGTKTFVVSVWMRSRISALAPWWPLVTEDNFKNAMASKLNIKEAMISDVDIGNPLGPVTTVVFNININRPNQENITIQTLQGAMTSLSIVLNFANFTFFKVVVKPFYCVVLETFHPNEYKFEGNAVSIIKSGRTFKESEFYTNETEWRNGSLVPTGILSVCKESPLMNCSGVLIRLTKEEYVILSNGSLYRNISRELLKPDRFHIINDTIWLCTFFSQMYERRFVRKVRNATEKEIVLVVLTYVGLSVSILSFLLVLVTYTLFEELRTLPGIYLMNLCLAHLLVNLLHLATGNVESKVACSVIAVLLHYFLLVSFTWMSIIAFETWKVFSKIRVPHRNLSRREKRFHLLRRITLGWFCAFVFIVICVTLDQSNTVVFQYGGMKGCWINNTHASLYFFVLPVSFSLSFNSVFFTLTVRTIRQTNNQTRRVTHHTQNRQTTATSFKISILMGFTWIFGFLQDLVSDYFEYLFIIFATLQGLYVVLAFVFKARVKQMYCTLLWKTNSVTGQEHTMQPKADLIDPVVLLSHVKKEPQSGQLKGKCALGTEHRDYSTSCSS